MCIGQQCCGTIGGLVIAPQPRTGSSATVRTGTCIDADVAVAVAVSGIGTQPVADDAQGGGWDRVASSQEDSRGLLGDRPHGAEGRGSSASAPREDADAEGGLREAGLLHARREVQPGAGAGGGRSGTGPIPPPSSVFMSGCGSRLDHECSCSAASHRTAVAST